MSQSYWNKRPYVETTKIFSPNLSENQDPLTVDKQQTITLINVIDNESSNFKKDIKMLQKQLQNLAILTSSLLSQNQKLRSHCHQRSIDLQNLVGTISINLSNELNDINMQINLLRQANCLIFNKIQSQIKLKEQSQKVIANLQSEINYIQNENATLQANILNKHEAKLKKKYNQQNTNKLSKQLQKIVKNVQNLTANNVDLLQKFSGLKKQRIRQVRQTIKNQIENRVDKNMLKQNIINTLKSLSQLRIDKEQLQDHYQRLYENQQLVQNRQKTALPRMHQKYKQVEESSEKYRLKVFKKEEAVSRINNKKRQLSQAEKLRSQKQQQLRNLKYKLYEKQVLLQNMDINFIKQKQKMSNDNDQKIDQLIGKIHQIQFEKVEAKTKFEEIKVSISENIEALKSQYQHLVKEEQDYRNLCYKFENFSKQTQRAEILQNLKKNRNRNAGERSALQRIIGNL